MDIALCRRKATSDVRPDWCNGDPQKRKWVLSWQPRAGANSLKTAIPLSRVFSTLTDFLDSTSGVIQRGGGGEGGRFKRREVI